MKTDLNTMIDMDDLVSKVIEAREEALIHGIEANMVVLNEKYAVVEPFSIITGDRSIVKIPIMLARLQAVSMKLPNNVAMLVIQNPTAVVKSYEDIYLENEKLKSDNAKLKDALERIKGALEYEEA